MNISCQKPTNEPGQTTHISERECSKKHALSLPEGSLQQGRSPFDARSVLSVREHGKRARTPLAAFFNIPLKETRFGSNMKNADNGDINDLIQLIEECLKPDS